MNTSTFDVCVIGAGLAGLAAANKLIGAGVTVAVLSPISAFKDFKEGDFLPDAAVRILRDLNLASILAETGRLNFTGVLSSWGTDELIATDFIPNTNCRGWQIDRGAFESAMFSKVMSAGGAFFDGKFKSAARQNSRWTVDGHKMPIEADWIIDASGRRAHFAVSKGAVLRPNESASHIVVRGIRSNFSRIAALFQQTKNSIRRTRIRCRPFRCECKFRYCIV